LFLDDSARQEADEAEGAASSPGCRQVPTRSTSSRTAAP
jgi:hypothetical protein